MSDRTCSISDCRKPVLAREWCAMHYRRWARNGDPEVATLAVLSRCSVKSCGGTERIVKGLCNKHLQRRKRGLPLEVVRRCDVCTDIFSPEHLGAKYCSKRCLGAATRDSASTSCTVGECRRPHRARGMCLMHWRRWARETGRERPPEWDERRRANWKKRYALSRGASRAERFEYSEIFERDGWVCGICGDPVDRRLEWPDPMSVSLDHVFPVSKGGEHSRENAQCAHLRCNVRKSNAVQVDAMSV